MFKACRKVSYKSRMASVYEQSLAMENTSALLMYNVYTDVRWLKRSRFTPLSI